jgi:predicted ribosomally synthesized peptide with nif11-like leader
MTSENNDSSLTSEAGQVQLLIAKCQSDPAFKAAFDAAVSPEEAVQVAARYGIAVCTRDIIALGKTSEELSDKALEGVSGGKSLGFFNVCT